ncbi:MAG: hypothetical protein K0Q73_7309 [Paenibacillus sp.]|nr:hypothetical protein [Paenibacillus sp.]
MHQITEVLPPSDPAAEWEINTQGSSNAKGDPIKVRYSELKGVYAWHIEYIGYAVQWIQRNMWMFAVVIGGGWLWLYRSASEPPS